MASPRIVVIGTSSGGIETLRGLVRDLPADFPAPICVVLHTSPQSPGMLDLILRRAGRLDAVVAGDGTRLKPACIYVPPPDHHLIVEPGTLRISRGPKENRFRPAIDPLFRSAAQVYGPGAVGVILSGNLDDGTAGLMTIKQLGGVAIVQDPDDALFPSMPQSALRHVPIDACVPIADLPRVLMDIITSPVEPGHVTAPPDVGIEVRIAKEENAMDAGVHEIGRPSNFACPDCHGVLLEIKNSNPLRFRCQTGHAYTAETLLAEINESIEDALWIAIRSLEEGRNLLAHLASHDTPPRAVDTESLAEQIDDIKRQSDTLRAIATQRLRLTPAGS